MFTAKAEANGLKIIPVLDVLDGVAVHAVRGKRNEYKPLKSVLCASADPLEAAVAFKGLGFHELYLADLDAITGGRPTFSLFKAIAGEVGSNLLVDAGVASLKRAEEVLSCGVSKVIIGTETLRSASFVAESVEAFGSDRLMVSLDLMGDCVLSGFELGRLSDPLAFLGELEAMGVSQVIVLNLKKVGSGEGVDITFLQKVLRNTKADIYVGGGVRDVADLLELKELGVAGVLVATALNLGKISPENLRQSGLL